ncbi:Pycsar system effector family protein [Streptomyces sp. NPDC047061]|uniref:Pycsar system effector family protein n=1 Tax=Streptomyces sp. NPDC047061 TaxID=3154605 RepID=UPI0033E656C1
MDGPGRRQSLIRTHPRIGRHGRHHRAVHRRSHVRPPARLGSPCPLWAGTILILIGGLFATLVVVPRLRSSKDLVAEAPNHFIYFGHLRHREAGELTTALLQTDVLPVLSQQLINMSHIAWRKHRHVQWSFICFGLGAVTVFVAGLFS